MPGPQRRRERRELGGLEHDRVAGRERRAELPRLEHERRVPRRDEPGDADRLAVDVVELRGRAPCRRRRAWATIRSAKKRKFSAARRAWPSAWVIGRPRVEGLELGEPGVAGLDDVGDPVQDARALARQHPRPRARRRTRAARRRRPGRRRPSCRRRPARRSRSSPGRARRRCRRRPSRRTRRRCSAGGRWARAGAGRVGGVGHACSSMGVSGRGQAARDVRGSGRCVADGGVSMSAGGAGGGREREEGLVLGDRVVRAAGHEAEGRVAQAPEPHPAPRARGLSMRGFGQASDRVRVELAG